MSQSPLEVWIEENIIKEFSYTGWNEWEVYSSIQGAVKHDKWNSDTADSIIGIFPCLFFLVCMCILCTCSFCQPHWETIFKLIMNISIFLCMHVEWSDRFAQGCQLVEYEIYNRDSWDLGLSPSLVHHRFTYDPLLQFKYCANSLNWQVNY